MTMPAILQTEIWSKETSRKMFIVLGVLSLTLLTALLSFVLWDVIQAHWLTAKERAAGRAALMKVNTLQDSSAMSEQDFSNAVQGATESVQSAQNVASTSKDKSIGFMLDLYLEDTKMERKMQQIRLRHEGAAGKTDGNLVATLYRSELNEALN